MRNDCNIIRDILPLYIEDMVSADTAAFVEEHLETCDTCRAELENMKNASKWEPVIADTQDNSAMPLKVFQKKWNSRKRIIIAVTALVTALAVMFVVSLSAGRAGGEIGFEAVINRVEGGIAYATVTDDDAGFGAKKLPEHITFCVSDLDEELEPNDTIYGCYLRGTIDGQTVRVVSVTVITPTE